MKRFTSIAALAAFLITATACGDDSSSDTGASDAPKAIISLSPTHTEVLFALGAGDQIINAAEAVEQGVFAVDVHVDEGLVFTHGQRRKG